MPSSPGSPRSSSRWSATTPRPSSATGSEEDTSALIFWGLGAAVGGPVFGLAGHTWRTGEHRYRALALGLLAAAFIAEAGYHLLVLSEPGVAVGFAVAGLLVPLLLGRSREDRLGAYVAAVPLALGAAGFFVFIWIYDVTSQIQA